MKKTASVLAIAAILASGVMMTSSTADAWWGWGGGPSFSMNMGGWGGPWGGGGWGGGWGGPWGGYGGYPPPMMQAPAAPAAPTTSGGE